MRGGSGEFHCWHGMDFNILRARDIIFQLNKFQVCNWLTNTNVQSWLANIKIGTLKCLSEWKGKDWVFLMITLSWWINSQFPPISLIFAIELIQIWRQVHCQHQSTEELLTAKYCSIMLIEKVLQSAWGNYYFATV